MRKSQPKVRVIRSVSKKQLKSYAEDKWNKKHRSWWLAEIGGIILWLILTAVFDWQNEVLGCGVVVFAIGLIVILIFQTRYSKRYWEKIKDKPQPIDLDKEID